MRQRNRLSEKLEDDKVVLGAQTVTHEPSIVEVYGDLGLDFVWIDFEHIGPAPYHSRVFEALTRAANVSGTELLVRLPKGEPALIRKVLDAGVRNLLIPRIETAAEVRQAVAASRFSYENDTGDRGIAASRASGWGAELDQEYVGVEDENTLVGVMIENMRAVENLDEILRVEELGFVVIGPADLSVSMGRPLDFENPEMEATVEQISKACESNEVPVGRLSTDVEETREHIESGAQLVRISSGEIATLRDAIGKQLNELEESTGTGFRSV